MLGSKAGRGLLTVLGCWTVGLLLAPLGVAAPGELDSSFGRMGEFALQTNPACGDGCPEYIGSNGQTLALQPDGKLLIAGQNFDHRAYVEGPRSVVVRLNSDGTLDGTFGSGGYAQTPAFEVRRLYASADGNFTSVGIADATNGFPDRVGIEHYSAAGATTAATQWFVVPFLAETAQIDSKGRLVVLGITTPPLIPHGSEPKIMRFLPTGALDRSFGEGGVISLQAPEVTTESPPSGPEAFALGNDGSVFVAATTYALIPSRPFGEPKAHTVLYHFAPNGKPDRSFGRGGAVALPASKGYESLALAVAPDGDVVLAAGEDITGSSKQARLLIVRYTKTGRPDSSFGSGGVAARAWDSISPDLVPSAIAFDARGSALIAGSDIFTPYPGSVGKWFLARLTDDGFDCSFGSRGVVLGGMGTSANAVAVQTEGRIVIVGKRSQEFAAARYTGGGTPRTCPGEHKSRKPKHRKPKRRHKRRRHR